MCRDLMIRDTQHDIGEFTMNLLDRLRNEAFTHDPDLYAIVGWLPKQAGDIPDLRTLPSPENKL